MNFIDWVKALIREEEIKSATNAVRPTAALSETSVLRPKTQEKGKPKSQGDNASLRSSLLTAQKLQDIKNQNKMQFTQLIQDIDHISQSRGHSSAQLKRTEAGSSKNESSHRPKSVLS